MSPILNFISLKVTSDGIARTGSFMVPLAERGRLEISNRSYYKGRCHWQTLCLVRECRLPSA
jgi:hypothetical protein